MLHSDDLELPTRPSLKLGTVDITEDADIRSPRTPIYRPTSPSFSSVAAFDPAKVFSNPSAPPTPKAVAPTEKNLPPPPSDPLAWVWQCHLCRSRWLLGVTRRCLVDGHFYCSGETSQPNLKKKRKGQSCSSEFDYVGWKEWGAWKRNTLKTISNPRLLEGCERCEFPSQCQYWAAEMELVSDRADSSPMAGVEYTHTTAEEDVARYYSNENVTFESILAKAEAADKSVQSKMTDSYSTDLKPSKSSEERQSKGEKAAKAAERRPSKKTSLSPIEEEVLRGELGAEAEDLVMPLIDSWGQTKEKRKSFP